MIAVDGGRHRAERLSADGAEQPVGDEIRHQPAPRARAAYVLQVVGRLKPGVSIDAAEADLGAVADGLAREFPQTNKGRGVKLERCTIR